MASNCDRRLAEEALAERQSSGGGGGDGFRPFGNPKLEAQRMSAAHKKKLAAAATGRKKTESQKRAISEGMRKCQSGGSANEATNILREKASRLELEIRALRRRIENSTGAGRNTWERQLERATRKKVETDAAISDLERQFRSNNARPGPQPPSGSPPTPRDDLRVSPEDRVRAERVRQQRENEQRRTAELAERQRRLNQSNPPNPLADIGNWRLRF